ncbi:MAG: deoxyhypusine synthase [Candidatus Aenigmatarchaeota archaeon]
MEGTKPVKDIEIGDSTKASELVGKLLESGGFGAKSVAVGTDIIADGIAGGGLRFLSFPACIIATGTRGVICDMIRSNAFNAVITTCGTLDHDLARIWKDYHHGDWMLDDRELRHQGVNRLGNVLVPNESYGEILEKKMIEFLELLAKEGKNELGSYELVWELGKFISSDPNAKQSIVFWCWKNKIPMVIPGLTDGAVGYQIWQFSQDHNFKINPLRDEQLLSDLTWEAERSGALIVGGGISKHHTIWWNQFRGGLDWAVYITTAVEWDGSLSGARPREAVSWGKINEKAPMVTIEADATIVLPLMWAAIKERMRTSSNGDK